MHGISLETGFGMSALRRGFPAAGVGVYPNATVNPYWSSYLFFVDLGWYYDIGVRPGDTVYDMTGRTQFTIPANGTLSSAGFVPSSNSNKIVLPSKADWARVAMWGAGVIYNPVDAAMNHGQPFHQWTTGAFSWELGRVGAQFGINYGDEAGAPVWFNGFNSNKEYMAVITWVDKVRLYATDNTYQIPIGVNPADRPVTNNAWLGDSAGITRAAWIVKHASNTAPASYFSPGTDGLTPIPARLAANGAKIFNAFTGVWT